MICKGCEKLMDGTCTGTDDVDAAPEDCINEAFCNSEPVRQLRRTQKETRQRVDSLLLLARKVYPEPNTA